MNRVPMTVEGASRLKEELNQLKTVDRPRIIQSISEARAHGDLKENAEYHAAREQQSFAEGRILELEGKLSHAQIINVKDFPESGKVIFGSTVTLLNVTTDEEIVYQIVGEDEANLKLNKISCTSPIARAIIGKEEGDDVLVRTPGGDVDFEISKVKHL